MDLKSLEALGITTEDLINRIVDKCTEELLTSVNFGEDGEEWRAKSDLARKLDTLITTRINDAIGAMAEKHVLPNVTAYIENLTLQATNGWGEKTGQKLTFIEYLTQRAEAYMQEKVSFDGKTKSEAGGYTWSGTQTRITFLVEKHLHYSIENAMKQALQTVNSNITSGIAETVRQKLSEFSTQLKVTTEVKKS